MENYRENFNIKNFFREQAEKKKVAEDQSKLENLQEKLQGVEQSLHSQPTVDVAAIRNKVQENVNNAMGQVEQDITQPKQEGMQQSEEIKESSDVATEVTQQPEKVEDISEETVSEKVATESVAGVKEEIKVDNANLPSIFTEEEFQEMKLKSFLPLAPVAIEPISPKDIGPIIDTTGKLSEKVKDFAEVTGDYVVPLRAAGIRAEVTEIKDMEVFTLDNNTFAFVPGVRKDVVKAWEDRILATLKSGLDFSESLLKKVTYDSTEYNSFALTKDEWSYLYLRFREFNPSIVKRDYDICFEVK